MKSVSWLTKAASKVPLVPAAFVGEVEKFVDDYLWPFAQRWINGPRPIKNQYVGEFSAINPYSGNMMIIPVHLSSRPIRHQGDAMAFYDSVNRSMTVILDPSSSKDELVQNLSHELIHANDPKLRRDLKDRRDNFDGDALEIETEDLQKQLNLSQEELYVLERAFETSLTYTPSENILPEFQQALQNMTDNGILKLVGDSYKVTPKGKPIVDQIRGLHSKMQTIINKKNDPDNYYMDSSELDAHMGAQIQTMQRYLQSVSPEQRQKRINDTFQALREGRDEFYSPPGALATWKQHPQALRMWRKRVYDFLSNFNPESFYRATPPLNSQKQPPQSGAGFSFIDMPERGEGREQEAYDILPFLRFFGPDN